MSEVKPLFLENGEFRQMSSEFTLDPTLINGSTVGRFNSQNSYKAGDIVIHDVGQGPAFYEANENLYPKAFTASDWTAVGTAVTGSQGDQGLDGAAGADAMSLVLTSDSQVFRYDSNGDPDGPDMVTFTAHMQNIPDGTLTWSAIGSGSSGSGSVDLTASGAVQSGATLTLTKEFFDTFVQSQSVHAIPPILTITASKSTFSDSIRLHKLRDGEDALTGFLTNSNHTTAAGEKNYVDSNADGVADSPILSGSFLDAAGGQFVAYRGFEQLLADVTFTVEEILPSGGATATIDSSGNYELTSVSSETVTVKLRAEFLGSTLDRLYTHTLSFQGQHGTSFLSGTTPPGDGDGSEGDFWLDTSLIVLYGPKGATSWPTPGMNLVGGGVDTDGDGLVDALVANGFLGHNRTLTRSLTCSATVNGMFIGEVTITDPEIFTIEDGGMIVVAGESIASAITSDELLDYLSALSVSGAWGDILNRPSTFPPEDHTHAISEITNLQDKLVELTNARSAPKLWISDASPPTPLSPEDETQVGDIWIQYTVE